MITVKGMQNFLNYYFIKTQFKWQRTIPFLSLHMSWAVLRTSSESQQQRFIQAASKFFNLGQIPQKLFQILQLNQAQAWTVDRIFAYKLR